MIEDQQYPVDENTDPKARRLRALAGPGNAYMFLSWGEEGVTNIDFAGLYPEDIPDTLRQIAGMI